MIGIIDLRLGNVGSIQNMCARLGLAAMVVREPAQVLGADRLILPGVGAFDHGMRSLLDSGLLESLREKVLHEGAWMLGICLGMQMFSRGSDEGTLPGLGWIAANTKRLGGGDAGAQLRTPHMGWNEVTVHGTPALFNGLSSHGTPRFYFVHSYHVVCDDPGDVAATVHYGSDMTAAVARRNIMGTQFHPEKSHHFGMAILQNFASLC
jgi:glutamine amidotransferase